MKKLIPITIALSVMVGCASLPEGHNTDKGAVTRSALKGGGIGCAVGAVTGLVFGKKDDAVKGCAAGAIVGGVSAAVAERNRQIEEANQLAAAARAQGLTATVTVVDAPVAGEAKAAPQLKGLTIDLPKDVSGHDVREIVTRAARMSDASKTPVTITVLGNKSQRASLVATLRSALKPNTTATVKEADSKTAALHLAPVPDVEG